MKEQLAAQQRILGSAKAARTKRNLLAFDLWVSGRMSRGAGGSGRRGPLPALAEELDESASDLAIRIWTIAAIRRLGARRVVFINTKTITRAQFRAYSTWERREISNRKRVI